MNYIDTKSDHRHAWNKGKLVGAKPPLKLNEIWAIRIRLELENRHRDLALFNLAIDSKLRGCDLVRLRVQDIATSGQQWASICFLAEFQAIFIYQRASTDVW